MLEDEPMEPQGPIWQIAPYDEHAAQQQATNAAPTTATAHNTEAWPWHAVQHANADAEHAAQRQAVPGDQEQAAQDAAPQAEHTQHAAQQQVLQGDLGDQEQVVPDAPPQVQHAAQQQATNADPTTETAPTEARHAAQHANAEAEHAARQQAAQDDQEHATQDAAPHAEHAQHADQQQAVQGDQEQAPTDAAPQAQHDAQQQATNATDAQNAARHAAAEAEYATHEQVVHGNKEQVFQDAAPQVELAQPAAQQQAVQGDQEQVDPTMDRDATTSPWDCDSIVGWSTSSSDVDSDAFEEQVAQYIAAHPQMADAAPTSFAPPARELGLMTDLDRIAHGMQVQTVQHASAVTVTHRTHAAPTTSAVPTLPPPELITDIDRIAYL